MPTYGVSFSIKQCHNFGVNSKDCLSWLIEDMGFRRFRLMSYWNEIEKTPGCYDFRELDRQIKQIKKVNGEVSLCLGARQPRWPENHWPDWVLKLSYEDRSKHLMQFVETIVRRYKTEDTITSYQLENEALLKDFGEHAEVDRVRLKQEYRLVQKLDPSTPIVMTTSTSWGVPLRQPIPDMVGFSYYQIVYRADLKRYTTAWHKPWMQRLRAGFIKLLWRKPSFIHELQLEPWGPQNIWEMPVKEQDKSMNVVQIKRNLQLAKATKLGVIDLWGGEWWYWRSQTHGDPTIAHAVKDLIT